MTSNEELFNCIFCKESFESKEDLQIHFRMHGDPKFNQSVKNRASNDSDACGDKSSDVDLVSCDVCPDTFPSISKAITHKHKVHPDHDAKYFCPWCGKLFTMKHLYNKHVETSHDSKMQYESKGFHCDSCEADFFAPSAMVYHNKFFHRQDTELAAIGQSRKLKLFDEDMLPLYYCPFCGEEYINKVNLHKHMGDDHSDENQSPDDVLRCPLCEAIFYHLDAYELHLTFHSAEDTYSEENEIVKNITEFSLEAVPPIMEKVENETTADSEATMGIGEFLQLGMDETADNEIVEKRKKKKKHKKSKKSAITLDEFLNMNKDVFGEGIDVEGIEEVPTRMVAKRLKTRPQRPTPPKKLVASSEIEKLKKQGIVVKKKLGNAPKFHSSLKGSLSSKPLNTVQNSIVNKVVTNTTKSNSTSDVLSKLLSQSNSQLKIVKKPLDSMANSNLKEQPTAVEDPASVNKIASDEKNINECDISKCKERENEELGNNDNGEVKIDSENTIKSNINPESHEPKNNNEVLEKNMLPRNMHENIELEIDKQNQEETSCMNEIANNRVNESVENGACESNLSDCHGNNKVNQRQENVTDTNKKSLNALKNLSHLTVKSMNPPRASTLNVTKIESQGCEVQDTDDTGKLNSNNSINKQEPLQKLKDDRNLEALKLLSKSITVKSSNKPVQIDKNLCSDQDQGDEDIDNLKFDNSINEEIQSNKPKDDKNLEALKLLGKNITIKSSNQTIQGNNDKEQDREDKLKNDESCNKQETPQKTKEDKNIESLKQLSKGITVKSPNKPVLTNKSVSYDIDQESVVNQGQNTTAIKNLKDNDKIHSNIQSPVKCQQAVDNALIKNASINSPKINKALLVKEDSSDLGVKQQPIKIQNCDNILKQLPNITAKPVSKTLQHIATAVSKSSNTISTKEGTCVKNATKIEEIKEIETFNIDDSDDEDEMTHLSSISKNTSMKTSKISLPNSSSDHIEKLKSLGQQVTIKSTSQQNPVKSSIHDDDYENSDNDLDDFFQDFHNDGVSKERKQCISKDSMDQKSFVLQNKLKNLSQNITVKSRNSSPKQIKVHQNDHESDSEIAPGKVKISELPDDFSDDDEFNKFKDGQQSNCVVESPEEYSENEECAKNNEQKIETKLKSNTLQKPILKTNNSAPNNLQNISKGITIKSLQNKNDTEEGYEPAPEIDSIKTDAHKDLSLKHQNNIPSKHVERSNYQVAKSSDLKRNTANTEVIVKKFGSKTVIEEITTTVTKTIRTVNQTVQQEVTNSSHIMSPGIKFQKIQNMIPRQQVYEGKQIRHGTPAIGTRVRNETPQVRPSIRPTNQIVSVRPGLNIRPSNQRMTVANKPTSTITSNSTQPVIGKPLKISPNVFSPSNKRPTSEDSNGPFSCFKKQKESLIPIGDLPEISQDDTSVLYTSSQMSKSHVSNTTKIMTGNSMMTSSQMKSASCSSSEQFTKLANMAGLRVVKTSSAQHASKAVECKMTKSNQNALEAIEKLKKQGLLIKKPRLDENHSEHSNSDDNYE